MTRQLTNTRFEHPRAIGAGLDVTIAGNRDLLTEQFGGVFVWDWFRAKGSLQLRAGYSRSLSSGALSTVIRTLVPGSIVISECRFEGRCARRSTDRPPPRSFRRCVGVQSAKGASRQP